MSGFLAVRNFDRFQHYKDRDPPWIRLYVRLLDDYEFARLPDAHKAHLIGIWILASKTENKIPNDAAWIGKKIGATEVIDLDALLASGFLHHWNAILGAGKREDWASRYVSAQTRADVLSAANDKCAECGGSDHLEIDHIVPISRGGTGDRENLQVLCRKCNRRKRVRLRAETAERMRSGSLRRTFNRRTPEAEKSREEAETEIEGEEKKQSVTVAVANGRPKNLEAVKARLAEVLAAVSEEGHARLEAAEMRKVQAALVFAYWASKMDHPKALLDHDRELRLVKRLEENKGDVHELLYVVDGARKDDWTMGRTGRSTAKYDGIETIYQDRAHVEKFAALCPAHKRGDPHPMAVKYLEAGMAVTSG